MRAAPRRSGSRPDWAGGIESGLEHRSIPQPQPKSQQLHHRLRRQRHALLLHRLGERVVFEFLDELARHHPEIADDIDRRLAWYAAIDPGMLRAVGGDRMPPTPLRLVRLDR